MPSKNAGRWGHILAGKIKYTGNTEFSDSLLSACYLRYARIDVNYYFGHWNVREQDCSIFVLLKLFVFKFFKGIYLSIFKEVVSRFIGRKIAFKRLRTPLKSKFEIYEALMNSEKFLKSGTFRKSELSAALFGNHYVGEFSIYQKVSQSLDWILEASVEDGELQKINPGNSDHDPLYKMKGKGIHYFTLTKEHLKNSESNKAIQQQQVNIQRRMAWLTVLLVIGTFMASIDKLDKIKQIIIQAITPLFPLVDWILDSFI